MEEETMMDLFNRITTLIKADAHGVVESLEERSLLLKQYVREAEIDLQRKRARLESLREDEQRLDETLLRCEEEIRQLDATHTHWTTTIGGVEREFDAEITEQHPDERVAWNSTTGPDHAGVVTFHRLGDAQTRVTVQIDWSPEGVVEKAGDLLQLDERRVKGDLARFKEFIESRGTETGAWRGDVG